MNYSDSEKVVIVTKYKQGIPVQELSTEYGISERTIYRWVKQYSTIDEELFFTPKEHRLLLRRVEKLENIVTILKTVNCTVHAPLKEKLTELELLYGQYDVHTLCEALDVSRGTFYNHILRNKRDNAWFEKRRAEYRVIVRDVFDEFRQVFGAEKIRTILVQRGHQVSTKYIASLMSEMGLSSVRTTAKQDYLKQSTKEKKKDIVRQQFHADRPNQIWVSDVTYFKLEQNHFYVCVIIDLFSRKVISYKISKKNSTQLITSTFKIACESRQPGSGLIFHSDRGSQYTSHRFQQLLHEHGIIQSFSNSGRPHDNAVAESFFASFKKEELYRKNYSSEKEFKQGVDSYIVFYNQQRPHRTLKNQTPEQVEFEFAIQQPDM
ncbi:IS3 family transposase [Oscillibacter sp.]|uniref:IS3 family transposase n=1 Tax=Oscillibacter sp. TaxID=1945593 RepID=UPI002D8115B2|nr:IS3 family transposase [Oscillibacter sp.]